MNNNYFVPVIKYKSECFIKPILEVSDSSQPHHLTPWDLFFLSTQYIQKGMLFANPPPSDDDEFDTEKEENQQYSLVNKLKVSLSQVLVHFYPLAGQLVTEVNEDQHNCHIYVDCRKGQGVKFVHAFLDLNVQSLLVDDVPQLVVYSLFDHKDKANYDGHTIPLLSVQVTHLADGMFIGCSMNHAVADGSSFWHFINMWSETFNEIGASISRPPIHKRWFSDSYQSGLEIPKFVLFPYTHPDQFIPNLRKSHPELLEKIFHFSPETLAKLKAKVNAECNTNQISSLQTLSALLWRSITRAECTLRQDQHDDQKTTNPSSHPTKFMFLVNNRQKLIPPLSQDYFGCFVQMQIVTVNSAEDLLNRHCMGSTALLIHQAVTSYTDKTVRDWFNEFMQCPNVFIRPQSQDSTFVILTSSPRFNMYGNKFGLGKPLAIRSGYASKFNGKIVCYPGREGGGSIDLEICLVPDLMRALELDEDFMAVVSA